MERGSGSEKFGLGSELPDFTLPNVDGKNLGSDFLREGSASLVVFTCNHCPYVIGSEEQMISTLVPYLEQGLKTAAICSNESVNYPDDSFDKMKEKSQKMNLPYPYLHDETQEVAKLFDAACTPELYLFNKDRVLVWHGKPNNNPRDPAQATENHLAIALDQLYSGQELAPSFVPPMGCSIKWK